MTDPSRLNDERWQVLKDSALEGSYDLAALKTRVIASAAGTAVASVGIAAKAILGAAIVVGATIAAVTLSQPASQSPRPARAEAAPTTLAPQVASVDAPASSAPADETVSTVSPSTSKPLPPPTPLRHAARPRTAAAVSPTATTTTQATTTQATTTQATTTRHSSSLAAEIAAYDEAVTALVAGRADDAHAALTTHRAQWPQSVLRPEVDLSDLEALLRAGRDEEARALAAVLVDDDRLRARRGEIQRLLNRNAGVGGDSQAGGVQ